MSDNSERRYVLLEVVPESETDRFQEDSYEEAFTEFQLMEMLARKLGYTLSRNTV